MKHLQSSNEMNRIIRFAVEEVVVVTNEVIAQISRCDWGRKAMCG